MATNRIDILDPALLRPGRIDRKIEFPNPNESSRADILRIHSRKMNLVRGIDLRKIADKMTGASGAELKVVIDPNQLLIRSMLCIHAQQQTFTQVRHSASLVHSPLHLCGLACMA